MDMRSFPSMDSCKDCTKKCTIREKYVKLVMFGFGEALTKQCIKNEEGYKAEK